MSYAREKPMSKEEADEKEKQDVIRRVRSLLKLGACKDQGKKLSKKAKEAKQTQQWKEIFLKCDRSGSGTLSFEDIKKMARKYLKIAERLVPDHHLQLFFNAIDEDGGGSVDFSEFLGFVNVVEESPIQDRILRQVKRTVKLSMWKHKMSMEELERRFYNSAAEGIVDMANSDGSLGPEEMRRFFRKVLNVTKHEAPDKNLAIAFKAMDEDGGGTLDAEEFLEFIRTCLEGDGNESPTGTVPALLGGMRGLYPDRLPRARPGTIMQTGEVSSLPFCLNGRDLLAYDRMACTTPAPLRHPRLRPARSAPSLQANGLPSIILSPTSTARTSSSVSPRSTMQSTAMFRSSSADKEDDVGPDREKYITMKGADSLNRVEHWLYNAGIDVRGHYHRLS